MKLLVLGIGNLLMNDDAAGVIAVQRLKEAYGDDTDSLHIVDGGTLGLDLLPIIEWADKLILIDAVNVGHEPGTVVRVEGDDINPVFETKLSPHQLGMRDLLFTAELTGSTPPEVVLFGIQSADINMAMTLSPKVEANMQKLFDEVDKEIKATITDS